MNISFIVTLSELGGAQKYVRDLAFAYAREGHHVSVAAGPDRKNTSGNWKQGWLFREVQSEKVRTYEGGQEKQSNDLHTFTPSHLHTYPLPHLERSIGFIREFRTLFDIIKIIKTERPDVIHLNSTKVGGLGGLAGRLTGVKSVYTVHGLVLNEPLPLFLWLWYWFLEKIAFALCNKIIVISKLDQQRILDLRLASAKKLTLIPLTVDPEALNFLPREKARSLLLSLRGFAKQSQIERETRSPRSLLVARDDKIVGTIANFYPTKDLSRLIDAASIVIKQKSDVRFIIIGDGPLRQDLESKIKNQELSNTVFLLGTIENASSLLPGLDLFVLSSVKEGLPQVLREAVAAGIPIASTNVGGIPDIAAHNPNHPWSLISPNNPQTLANTILTALDNYKPVQPKSKETLNKEFLEFTRTTHGCY